MSDGAPTIQIPRWIQLVGLPILALIALLIVGKVFHAVFLFLVAGLIALLLDPLVRALERLKIPRGFSIAIVYLTFAAALAVVVLALGVIVIDQSQSAANRIDDYVTTESGQPPQTGVERDVDRLQLWLDTHHLERIDIRRQGQDFAENIKGKDVEKYTSEAIDFLRGAAISIFQLIFSVVLVLVVSIYMLLDLRPAERRGRPALPAEAGTPGLDPEHGAGGRRLRARAGAALADHRRERGRRALGAGHDRPRSGRGPVRRRVRLLGRVHGADPLPRPVARSDPADPLRARRRTRSRPSGSRCSSSGSTRSRAMWSSRT